MENKDWRKKILDRLDCNWDIVIIGGGITGAGIFRESTRLGLKTLLIEQRDFAWGTSSRSSKLVHGGFRYLKDGRLLLTRVAVLERKRLLGDGPGLIDPLGFLLTIYKGDFPGRWTYQAGLSIYDLLALQWGHRYYSADELNMLAPHLSQQNLEGGFQYGDAQTDDSRLVLRLIQEAVCDGGIAINYVKAEELILENDQVSGVQVVDCETDEQYEITAKILVNATGVWVDKLRSSVVPSKVIRPLRGSHLLFPSWRLPVAQAICFLHPHDRRPVFIFPWEGVTIVGTTDVDHAEPLDLEASISSSEVSYLMAAVESQFPSLNIGLKDIVSTFAGVRPVIGTGKSDPSQESRDHMVWNNRGLITVTGGKLTTFRILALEVIKKAQSRIPDMPLIKDDYPVLNLVDVNMPGLKGLEERLRRRLLGRYGNKAESVVGVAKVGELNTIPGTDSLWVELRWAARSEYVCHLDDLMLRRLRLGLVLPRGGKNILSEVRSICQPELDWDDEKWEAEQSDYLNLWNSKYYLPENQRIPDWKKKEQNESFLSSKIISTKKNHRILKIILISSVLFFTARMGYKCWKKMRV